MYTLYDDILNINFNRIIGLRIRDNVGKHSIKIALELKECWDLKWI